jgi:hypothetical protein
MDLDALGRRLRTISDLDDHAAFAQFQAEPRSSAASTGQARSSWSDSCTLISGPLSLSKLAVFRT